MNTKHLIPILITILVSVAAAEWSDNFDSYLVGGLHGQGGWAGWDNNPAYNAEVTDYMSNSPLNSIGIVPTTDIVHEFNESSGVRLITVLQYIPSGGSGDQLFIMHNEYTPGGSFSCALDIVFFQDQGNVVYIQGAGSTSILFDQWVEIKVEIDLDSNTQTAFYNGVSLGSAPWATSGAVEIATINLFSYGASSIYYDDFEMVNGPAALEQMSWAGVKVESN